MRVHRRIVVGVAFCGLVAGSAHAAQLNVLYADSAGSNRIDIIDATTGALIRSCSPSKGNGRGMVVVAGIGYFTVANSNNVYKLDINTCADLGVAFSVAGATGLSTIAYDGANFWIGDYSGSNNAYYYSPTGTQIKSIALANCTGFCDGLEYFDGKLISNRGDAVGPYDVYDTNGNLLQAAFITPTFSPTGIAFNGTDFYVSDIFNAKVAVFDGISGALINTLTLTGGSGFLIEDVSFDYSQRPDTGGQAQPAPALDQSGLIVLMLALLGLGVFLPRFRRVS